MTTSDRDWRDYDADPEQDTGGAAAWAVAAIGVGLLFGAVLALWLLAG